MIPILAAYQCQKGRSLKNVSIYSLTSCTAAPIFHLFEIKYQVTIGDFSAIMDTIGAISIVSVILVIITFALNIAVAAYVIRGTGDSYYDNIAERSSSISTFPPFF